jgi:PAS domain-containing protein
MNSTLRADVADPSLHMGFFTWDVQDNLLFGDEVFGEIYGFSKKQLATGIAFEVILDRVAIEDRGRIAGRVHYGIVSGTAGTLQYTVLGPNGTRTEVVSFGRCLKDADGIPSLYTGTVMRASHVALAVGISSMEVHCRAAVSIARKEGRELTVRYLSSALRSLGLTDLA